jgi:hypothetical protein
MSCLGSFAYDPATAATKSAAAALAMTAIDTANARVTFTVPASGKVLVRQAANISGGSATPWCPSILLGVLQGATVIHRQAPAIGPAIVGAAGAFFKAETSFVVSGLTPGASLSWDMAYGVELAATGAAIKYGGPNDATASTAWGALVMDVWDA